MKGERLARKKPAKKSQKRLYIDIGGGRSSKFYRLAAKNKNPERKFWILEQAKSPARKPANQKNLSILKQGALKALKRLPANSVNWINSDFVLYTQALGRWNWAKISEAIARESFRVLKPGSKLTVTVIGEDKHFVARELTKLGFELDSMEKVPEGKLRTHWEKSHAEWSESLASWQRPAEGFWPNKITFKKPSQKKLDLLEELKKKK